MRVTNGAKIAAASALLALAVAACGGGSSSPGASGSADTPVRVYISEPQNDLIGGNTGESGGAEVLKALYAGLVDYNDKAEPQLEIAESIEHDATNTNWTIKIKPGYTWSDGTPVTAQNFVDAWNFTANSANAQQLGSYFSIVKGYDALNPADPDEDGPKTAPPATTKTLEGLKVVDDSTFTVELTHPFSGFETALGYSAFFPLPKAAFGADGKLVAAESTSPITNGPFKIAKPYKRGTDQTISVTRNDSFKGGKAKVANIDYKIYTDPETAYNDLLAGNLDVMDTLPASQVANAKATFGNRYIEGPSSGVGWLGFNIKTGGVYATNPELRKAISMSIDRKTITQTVFSGTRTAADDNISPLIPGYRQGACGEACNYDPAAAKQLWESNGGSAVKEVTLSYNADGGHKEWIEAVANNLRTNLGVAVTPKPYEKFAAILDDLGAKKVQGAFRLAWLMDWPLPDDYLRPVFGTGGSSNYVQYSNKQFDELLNKGDAAPTLDEAIKFYQQADDLALKDLAYVPIYFYQLNAAYSQNVKNVKLDPFEALDVLNIEKA
ncbi:putative peptide ABC transporter DppA [Planotetraspora thailandica]|uniref:Putative peptide ABC transporter DppA n=1 Tax=Planotetraspora thailandica TaxID=487172 RepID=A0A8J3Y0F3_9ACTN|nr:ABC transporter substrate-binding protein [Planotetraspora thailandica]GII58504.1 putative peptide ABC transporter DppA [Planotetraspora thailandica]